MSSKFQLSYTPVKALYQLAESDLEKLLTEKKIFTLKGYVRFKRGQKDHLFIKMYDGSHPEPIQIIFDNTNEEMRVSADKDLAIGVSFGVKGTVVRSPAKGQLIEFLVSEYTLYGAIDDPAHYLPSIKQGTLDTFRRYQDLRPKFHISQSIFRIRSELMRFVHTFFPENGFRHLDPNIVTTSDCEGAGEVFTITGLMKSEVSSLPTVVEEKEIIKADGSKEIVKTETTTIDYSQDFFGKQAFLTVSSQLQLEALCAGMGAVYTTNPSFRAERSKTKRHLCCFTHLEWEIPHIELKDLMDFSEDFVSGAIVHILKHCHDDLIALEKSISSGLIERLKSLVKDSFARISYDEAIDIFIRDKDKLQSKFDKENVKDIESIKELEKDKLAKEKHLTKLNTAIESSLISNDDTIKTSIIDLTDKQKDVSDKIADIKSKIETIRQRITIVLPKWGDDLSSFFERYLAEDIFAKPVLVYKYPKTLKAFYMKQCDPYTYKLFDGTEEIRHVVDSCDLLIPGMGELIGSSIREDNADKLETEIKRRGIDPTPLQWYVDMRKSATFPHGGAGLGFDRLVTIFASSFDESGMSSANIRDVVPFPVAYTECYY